MGIILAKSTGETLVDHSRVVARFAERLYASSAKRSNDKLSQAIKLAALLHDIGKCTTWFQQVVLKSNEQVKRRNAVNYRHNEVGWAFLSKFLNVDEEVLDFVLDAVYWHHGITNELGGYHDDAVMNELTQTDVNNMSAFLCEVVGEEMLLNEPREDARFAPRHFNKEEFKSAKAYQKPIVRSCIISGDRMASSVPVTIDDASIEKMISAAMMRSGSMAVTTSKYAGARFDEQLDIAKKDGRTKLVKAPAGYGKTVIALLWASLTSNRIIWVCPRNMVAESVYHSILDDMQAMGMEVSIELYLSGEVMKSHKTGNDGFTADIIVTNIDSFLFPSIKNSVAERQFLINSCDVVFDEFHELVNENAMFASFINTMRCRHRESNGRTLLLSATPMDMIHMWDSIDHKTVVLPNKETHYKAVHTCPYHVHITNDIAIEGGANLVISNAIATAQELKCKLPTDMLVHSEFSSERKSRIYDEIIAEFGKQSPRHSNKSNVSSTHVLQAAVDASFMNLSESVMSPESTLQRIGRCNRWGDNPTTSNLSFRFDNSSVSERTVRGILYDDSLSRAWYDRLKALGGKNITLNEFYLLYNKHYEEDGKRIRSYINNKWDQSVKQLHTVYPYQHSGNPLQDDKEIINADSNRLRSNGDQVFFIVRKSDGGWSDAMTHTVREGFEQDFKEDGSTAGNILRAMKEITSSGDPRYDYADIIKSIDKRGRPKRTWSKLAKMSNTPYIRFDEVYDEEFGVIRVDLLFQLRKKQEIPA